MYYHYIFTLAYAKVEKEVERIAKEVCREGYYAYSQQPFYVDIVFNRELTEAEKKRLTETIKEKYGLELTDAYKKEE